MLTLLGVVRIRTHLKQKCSKCPYCKQVVTLDKTKQESADVSMPETVHKEVAGLIKKEIMYSCPHCDSILGFGFFLGGLLTDRP